LVSVTNFSPIDFAWREKGWRRVGRNPPSGQKP
jgi:hypothetical protein